MSKMTGRRCLRQQPVWLHPAHFEHTPRDLERAWNRQMKESDVAVMMIHSTELMPAGSYRTPTEESVRLVLRRLDAFLAFIQHKGSASMTLSNAAAEVRSRHRLDTRPLQGGR